MNLIEAAKQALEALTNPSQGYEDHFATITNLRAAIEELEKAEPVAWMRPSAEGYDSAFRDHNTVVTSTGNPWTNWVPLYTHPFPGWQPIETAPKDGTEIFARQVGTPERGLIYWDETYEKWIEPADDWGVPNWTPTHWMPLPPPPKGETK